MARGGTLGTIAGLVVVAVVAVVGGAGEARAERFAVLPVDAQRDGGKVPVQAATAVRAALVAQHLEVLDVDATRQLIVGQLSQGGTDVAAYKKQLERADAAVVALDQDASLRILDDLISDLKKDPDFSREKQQLLEGARLKLAARKVALAGPKETGAGETAYGQQARALLVDALRANPKLAPSADEYPPRFLALVSGARKEIATHGTGSLIVDSRPQGATVFLEGRDIGKTPLNLDKGAGLAAGKYRLWVESAGARSVPQFVEIGESPTQVFVDLAFEGALWADGPGLRPLSGASIDEEVAKKIGRFLGVDTLLLVGKSFDDSDEWLWGAAFSVAEGTTARRGAVHLAPGVQVTSAASTLASFLGKGDHEGVENGPLPPSVLPEKTPTTVAGTPSSSPSLSVSTRQEVEDIPWVPIGVTAGAVVAVAAVAGGIAAIMLSSPAKEPTAVIAVRGIDEQGK